MRLELRNLNAQFKHFLLKMSILFNLNLFYDGPFLFKAACASLYLLNKDEREEYCVARSV